MPAPGSIVPPDEAGIAAAVRVLCAGELVGMPTETVYGLAADARSPQAVARVFAAKGRPAFNPLIAHVANAAAAAREGVMDTRAHTLAAAFWPGPLTLVVPVAARSSVCELARAGLATLALRVPSHPVAAMLLEAFGGPLAAPSANRSGRVSPTLARHVIEDLGDSVSLVLDAGATSVGIESTIVALLPDQPPRLLRAGAVARAALEELVGPLAAAGRAVAAPGQLTSHYAPRARVRLNATAATADEVLLAFGPDAPPGCTNLSRTGDLTEAAANLYGMLRELDAAGPAAIAVMPVPACGLGEAINDRLRRAAAARSPDGEAGVSEAAPRDEGTRQRW